MRVVILCGGSGSRLWPESRETLPKQFIPIFNNKSLLDLTVERVLNLIRNKKPIFVCNKNHSFIVKETLDKYNIKGDIILEPESKNTCPAIYMAAKYSDENDNLAIIPSDHFIPNSNKFLKELLAVEQELKEKNWITLGIKPTKSSEGYGYVKVIDDKNKSIKKVIKFIEKPPKEVAFKFFKSGDYFWNAGIFLAKASTIISSVKLHANHIAKTCDEAFREVKVNKNTNEIYFSPDLFSNIPSNSIDYAVMEKEQNIFLFPFNSEWSDVGSWDSISKIYKKEIDNNKVEKIESQNNFVISKKRTIATIGVSDLIIIDTDDATLISKKNHSEKVKLIVEQLRKKNFLEAKEHSFEYRPWGKFENLLNEKNCKVKKIIVNPKKRLSLQFHNLRSEHWTVVSGVANVYLDGKEHVLSPGQGIDIPVKSHHYVENKKNKDLIIIETQLGSYFGEDDIIRLDDPYSRQD